VPQSTTLIIHSIPVDQIHLPKHKAEKVKKERLQGLAESIRKEGLVQPITVKRATDSFRRPTEARLARGGAPRRGARKYRYELVSGARRLAAIKFLGWTRIDARVIGSIKETRTTRRLESRGADPLNTVWPALLSSPSIDAIGAWVVSFKQLHWNFAVSSEALPSKEALAHWFHQMGDALMGGPDRMVLRTSRDCFAKPFRLPTTPDEEAELQALAVQQGPSAVYLWLYGKGSPLADVMDGLDWRVLGVQDPKQGLAELLISLRAQYSARENPR
jgi:hypothetical protein